MAYFRRRDLGGEYSPLDFVLPSNSLSGPRPQPRPLPVTRNRPAPRTLPRSAAATAALVRAAANAAQKGRSTCQGMSGAYGPPPSRWPGAYTRTPYGRAGMGDVSSTIQDLKTWITDNPVLAGGAAIAAFVLLGGIRGRRR